MGRFGHVNVIAAVRGLFLVVVYSRGVLILAVVTKKNVAANVVNLRSCMDFLVVRVMGHGLIC